MPDNKIEPETIWFQTNYSNHTSMPAPIVGEISGDDSSDVYGGFVSGCGANVIVDNGNCQ